MNGDLLIRSHPIPAISDTRGNKATGSGSGSRRGMESQLNDSHIALLTHSQVKHKVAKGEERLTGRQLAQELLQLSKLATRGTQHGNAMKILGS